MYVARQPILDTAGRIAAYELLFRSGSGPILDGVFATASVAAKAFADGELGDILGPHTGFVNVDAAFLESDLIEFLPPGRCALELLETIDFTPERVERCRALKQMGYTLAADDYAGDRASLQPVLGLLDIIKVDITLVSSTDLERVAREFPGKIMLAEKVETRAEAHRCRAAGFSLFQGYYFARPERASGTGGDPHRLAALRLLGLVAKDADDDAITQEVKGHPALIVGLLHLVNSAAARRARPIASLRQALQVLGRRPLQLWLQLLVYLGSGSGDPGREPLLQVAAVRAKTMEALAAGCGRTDERAFMTGLLSLFDSALGLSLDEIARRLGLDDEIRDALCARKGELGTLLILAEAMERGDHAQVKRTLASLPALSGDDLATASQNALRWAAALGGGPT